MKKGNDKYLYGLPEDLEQAIETFLAYYQLAPDYHKLIGKDEDHFLTTAHHGAGQFIRNNWFLWWHENHPYDTWPISKPPIVKWFNDKEIAHADDMSSIIMVCAWRDINNKPRDLEGQIKEYKKFWKQHGFKDGIPPISS